ncbi:kinase-like domain-containing protein [Chytridium lagenaria]|nr:kinase-like domain-containing protein [Chytridium lagenaria]
MAPTYSGRHSDGDRPSSGVGSVAAGMPFLHNQRGTPFSSSLPNNLDHIPPHQVQLSSRQSSSSTLTNNQLGPAEDFFHRSESTWKSKTGMKTERRSSSNFTTSPVPTLLTQPASQPLHPAQKKGKPFTGDRPNKFLNFFQRKSDDIDAITKDITSLASPSPPDVSRRSPSVDHQPNPSSQPSLPRTSRQNLPGLAVAAAAAAGTATATFRKSSLNVRSMLFSKFFKDEGVKDAREVRRSVESVDEDGGIIKLGTLNDNKVESTPPPSRRRLRRRRIRREGSWRSWDPHHSRVPLEVHFLKSLTHPAIEEKYVLLVTELHGTQWDPANPELCVERNPGLRAPKRDVEVKNEAKTLKKRTSCDLFECIDKRIPEHIGKKIFAQIALAIKHLHDRNIVHRDLKDENIVIDSNYLIKIVDFGSASSVPHHPSHYFTKFNGTAHFASPEVARGEPFRGPEAEVWSLGVLLFTIVYGENPFQNKTEILAGGYKYPFRVESDATGYGCRSLIERMLCADLHKRASIEEVLNHPWLKPEVVKFRHLWIITHKLS